MDIKDQELIAALRKAIKQLAEKRAEQLIENNPIKYEKGEGDYGYYNNGCGVVCYGKEPIYDENKAYVDAIEEVATDIANESYDYEYAIKLFIDNKELTSQLAEWIRWQ